MIDCIILLHKLLVCWMLTPGLYKFGNYFAKQNIFHTNNYVTKNFYWYKYLNYFLWKTGDEAVDHKMDL